MASLYHYQVRILSENRRTSVRLESTIWNALQDIAMANDINIHKLTTLIYEKSKNLNISSALRVFVVMYYRAVANGATPNIKERFKDEEWKIPKVGRPRKVQT